jgi:predicted transcriptional regulator
MIHHIAKSTSNLDKLTMLAQITAAAQTGAQTTQIQTKTHLTPNQLTKYLKVLSENNLLQKTTQNGKETYQTTKQGINFLTRHQQMSMLDA